MERLRPATRRTGRNKLDTLACGHCRSGSKTLPQRSHSISRGMQVSPSAMSERRFVLMLPQFLARLTDNKAEVVSQPTGLGVLESRCRQRVGVES